MADVNNVKHLVAAVRDCLPSLLASTTGKGKGKVGSPRLLPDDSALTALLAPLIARFSSLACSDLLTAEFLDSVSKKSAASSSDSSLGELYLYVNPPSATASTTIRCVVLHEDPSSPSSPGFELSLFLFPPNASMPLHNHPDMCVLSKLLHGDLTVTTFEPLPAQQQQQPDAPHPEAAAPPPPPSADRGSVSSSLTSRQTSLRSALSSSSLASFLTGAPPPPSELPGYLSVSSLNNPPPYPPAPLSRTMSLLLPSTRNVHAFSSGPLGAVLLDVIIPPYNLDEGRGCTYSEEVVTPLVAGSSTPKAPPKGPSLDGNTGTDGEDYDWMGPTKGQGAEQRRSCLVREIEAPDWLDILSGTFDAATI